MSLMMVSCGGAKSESKVEVESAEPAEVQGVECVASGDVVFLDFILRFNCPVFNNILSFIIPFFECISFFARTYKINRWSIIYF